MTAHHNSGNELLERLLLGQLPPGEVERLCIEYADDERLVALAERLGPGDPLLETIRAQATDPEPADPRLERLISRLLATVPLAVTPSPEQALTVSVTDANQTAGNSPLPQQFDQFRILSVLGRGGMGTVYLAHDTRLDRQVALKTMQPELAANAAARERFLREARSAAAIEHENIIPIYHVGEVGGVPFLAMPLLKGEGLDKRLARGGGAPLPLGEILALGREIAEGLGAAHDRGLVHRDVKPGNVWLEDRGPGRGVRVKLLDFGLARPIADDAHLTRAGAIVGTPAYMAPEQARGEVVDARADLFSLGCVLYHLATGRPPFTGQNTLAVLTSLAVDQPLAAGERNPALPPQLSALITRLLAKDSALRPESAHEVVRVLADIERKQNATPSTVAPRRAGRWRWGAVAAGLAATVVLAVVAAQQIIIIRDKNGKEVGRVELPPGGSFEFKPGEGEPKGAPPAIPPAAAKGDPPVPRLPAGDDPPAKDAFPGKLIFYDTFTDPKACMLFHGSKDGAEHSVEKGAYVIERPAGKPGEGMEQAVPPAPADTAFAVRVRATNAVSFIAFGHQKAGDRMSWLSVAITPGGRWSVQHDESELKNGKRDARGVVLAQSDGPDPMLAAGQWVNLAGRAVGRNYEVWVNGKRVAHGAYTPILGTTQFPGLHVGSEVAAAGPARVEVDYLAAWDLSDPLPLSEWLKGREVLTVSQDGKAQFKTIRAAFDALKPGQVVKVLDKGPYRESGSWPGVDNTALVSEVGTRIEITKWTLWGADPANKAKNVYQGWCLHSSRGFRLSGCEFSFPEVPADASVTVAVELALGGEIVVESCRITHTPSYDRDPTPQEWNSSDPLYSSLRVRSDDPGPSTRVVVRDNHLEGTVDYFWGKAVQVVMERNRVLAPGLVVAVRFYLADGGETTFRNNVLHSFNGLEIGAQSRKSEKKAEFLIANNVFDVFNCPAWAGYHEDQLIPQGVRIQNNIVHSRGQTGFEVPAKHVASLKDHWQVSHNAYRTEPRQPLDRGADMQCWPLVKTDIVTRGSPFISAARGELTNYFRIPSDSKLATGGVGGDLPTYIGAFPPGPAPKEGDWFTRLQKPASIAFTWPAAALREGRITAPDLSKIKPRFDDDLSDPKTGWFHGKTEPDKNGIWLERGYDQGKHFLLLPVGGEAGFATPCGKFSNFAVEVSGRLASPTAERWRFALDKDGTNRSVVNVFVRSDGKLDVEFHGEGWTNTRVFPPFKHVALKKPDEFNKVLLVLRDRRLEIYVNGIAVCDPITLEQSISPALVALGGAGGKGTRVEYERVTIWPADEIPTPEERSKK